MAASTSQPRNATNSTAMVAVTYMSPESNRTGLNMDSNCREGPTINAVLQIISHDESSAAAHQYVPCQKENI